MNERGGTHDAAGPKKSPRRTIRKIILIPIIVISGLYGLLCLFAVGCADKVLFQPPPSSYKDGPEIIKITAADGLKISAIHLANPAAAYTILFSHGNAEDMGTLLSDLEHIRSLGFAVLAYDYHGYGTSQGKPSEAATYQDIKAAYDYLTGTLKVPPDRIIVYGRSVGSGPSVDLLTTNPAAGLVLQSGFTSAFRVFTRITLLPGDRYRNLEKIPRVHCPVLVMHGRSDHIVPFSHGQKLHAAANEPKQFLWVDGAGHNDFIPVAGSRYDQALKEFAELIRKNGK